MYTIKQKKGKNKTQFTSRHALSTITVMADYILLIDPAAAAAASVIFYMSIQSSTNKKNKSLFIFSLYLASCAETKVYTRTSNWTEDDLDCCCCLCCGNSPIVLCELGGLLHSDKSIEHKRRPRNYRSPSSRCWAAAIYMGGARLSGWFTRHLYSQKKVVCVCVGKIWILS